MSEPSDPQAQTPTSDHDWLMLVVERQRQFRRAFDDHLIRDEAMTAKIDAIKGTVEAMEKRFDRATIAARTAVAVLLTVEVLGVIGVGKVITAAVKAAAGAP